MNTCAFNLKNVSNSSLVNLPGWMTDGDLLAGQVESSCSLRTTAPGVPLNCMPVHPEFMHAINDLLEGRAGFGSNTGSFVAEDNINNQLFAAGFLANRISACRDGNGLGSKSDLPLRMVFLLSMPEYMKESEFASAYTALKNAQNDVDRKSYMAILADVAYTVDASNPVTSAYQQSSLLRLTTAKAGNTRYIPAMQEGAQFSVWQNVSSQANAATVAVMNGQSLTATTTIMDPKDFNGKFAVCKPEDLTPEERQLVPVIGDEMVLNEQHLDVCETIQKSLGTKHPFCNFLFRGQPGGGKSTFVKIIAAGLGLPFYSDVMRSDMDADFFSGYFAPNCTKDNGTAGKTMSEFLKDLPSAEDMAFDPVTSYQQITGKNDANATPEKCWAAACAATEAFAKQCVPTDDQNGKDALVFVEGLVPKLERPCVIFYDEVTAPRNPAAITALNTLMDRQRVFTLSNGHVVHRHPLSVMCFAGNFSEDGIELEGAHDPNRTWQDRNNEVINIRPLGASEMKGMLMADTGWNETDNGNIPIDMFVTIMPELQKICATFYGVCGFRAIADWLAKSMMIGSPIKAAETTVIPKSTNDEGCAAEMRLKIKNRFSF